jgi:5'(3')-deoxyribonucleotidase
MPNTRDLNKVFGVENEVDSDHYVDKQKEEKRYGDPKNCCIALDIDGVIRDFAHQMVKVFNKHYPQMASLVSEPDTWTNWKIAEQFPIGNQIFELMEQEAEEVFFDAPLIAGALDGIKSIKKAGYKIIIISAQHGDTAKWSMEFIDKIKIKPSEIYFEEDKHKMINYFDYIVEDNPRNIVNIYEAGGKPIVFDHMYNRTQIPLDIERNIKRVNDWKELVEYFLEPHQSNPLIQKILRGWGDR